MVWLLLFLLPLGGSSRIETQETSHRAKHNHEEAVAVTTRPYIYRCRSPNMEDFTCWWHPLDNLTGGEVTYLLTYSKDKGPKRECPDYTTGGPNSCHFDRSHTFVWTSYCMNVTAITPQRNYTSKGLCLDVADIGIVHFSSRFPDHFKAVSTSAVGAAGVSGAAEQKIDDVQQTLPGLTHFAPGEQAGS